MLKKSSLLILSILLSSSMLFAQGFHLGAKFGTDIQKVTGKPFSDKFAFGYHLGLYGEIMINSKISIQPELYYSAANFDTASNFSTVYNSITLSKLKFGYINEQGEEIIECKFDYIGPFRNGRAVVKLNGKLEIIDTEGAVITEGNHGGEQ